MAVQLPNGKQQFLDADGVPLALGSVYFYIPNTSTLKNTWQDEGQTILNTNPVVLDAAGEAVIWGSGQYRQLVLDALGNTIWDQITGSTTTASSQALGQCKLVFTSTSVVTLTPWNGNILTINGANQTIPDAGVTLAPSGLTPATIYYIYAYMNSSTMTLEGSTTAYTPETGTGLMIKSGDATRTLVGMVYIDTGPAFADDGTKRYTRSWFNETGIVGGTFIAMDATTTSTTFVEITTTRAQYVAWPNERVLCTVTAQVLVTGSPPVVVVTGLGQNSTSTDIRRLGVTTTTSDYYQCATQTGTVAGVSSAAFNYLTVIGKTPSGTARWAGDNNQTGLNYISVRR